MKHFAAYVAALIAFVGIDLIWLLGVARSTYVAEIGGLLRDKPNMAAAVAFYLLYVAGLWFFVIRSSEGQSLAFTLMLGAALGLLAYGTYDLTNLSVMKGFGLRIALIDMAWGTVLTAASAAVGALTLRALS